MEGGNSLKKINFEEKKEALAFCDWMLEKSESVSIDWNSSKKWGYLINIDTANESDSSLHYMLIQGLIHVFLLHRESSWLTDIIRNCYYYEDEDEVGQIYEMCLSFLKEPQSEEEKMVPCHELSHGQHIKLLHQVFQKALNEETVFHFDSIVTFRLYEYRQELIEFVGYAIDEYKREEEYQLYIEHLREYINLKPVGVTHLIILQGEPFQFYNTKGHCFTPSELKSLSREEPLYLFGLNEEELNIAPLIALAPEKISLYGDNYQDPKSLTVRNVFQERVEFFPRNEFPFKRQTSHEE